MKKRKLAVLLFILLICFVGTFAKHRYSRRQDTLAYTITGKLQGKVMDEISGIAASGFRNNIYYVHNDSGDTSRFFAITPDGRIKNTIYFKGDPKEPLGTCDFEDIAVGPGPEAGKSYVYAGDIGDNAAKRKYITIYRIEEQHSWDKDSVTNAPSAAIHFKYPDQPKDAETLMVDPIEKLFYIVSKRSDSVTVYTSPLSFHPNDTLTLTKRCKLHFKGWPPFKWITAGDISKDGQQILLKNYTRVYYWRRENNEPIWKTMMRKPDELPYKQEKQGEAIGFTPDGKAYYTTSEGLNQPIYYYKLPVVK